MNMQYFGNPFVPFSAPSPKQVEQKPKKRYKKPLLLTTAEAADYLGIAEGTLRVWRCSKATEIPFTRIGGSKRGLVRYRVKELDRYLENQVVAPEGWDDE